MLFRSKGRPEIYGVGNYFLNLTDEQGRVLLPLVFLDSNMYGENGWFYSGFDCIHEDQACLLYTSFGDLEVLKDISTEITEGEVVVILGPSGSGKSTFLRCLNRLEMCIRDSIRRACNFHGILIQGSRFRRHPACR